MAGPPEDRGCPVGDGVGVAKNFDNCLEVVGT